jgi:hypothetical protein
MSTKPLPPEFPEVNPKPEKTGRDLTRRDFVKIASAVAGAAAVGAAAGLPTVLQAGGKKTKIDAPTITCATSTEASISLQVCAASGTGATGLPAGFSIQWMTAAAYAANGGWYTSDDLRLCKASFSGNANLSRYNLTAGECVIVNVGEFLFDNGASSNCIAALACGTDYVFRAFGHATSALNRSDFTATRTCSTLACSCPQPPNCTLTQGYWKTHGPAGCVTGNNTNEWPVTSLTLGSVTYTDLEVCSILNTPAAGNGLIALAHQLIAAKLNVAKGADGTAVAQAIADADALIGGLVIPPVGSGSLAASATSTLTGVLANYNEGAIGPGHCC